MTRKRHRTPMLREEHRLEVARWRDLAHKRLLVGMVGPVTGAPAPKPVARPRSAKPRYCKTPRCGTKLNCYSGTRQVCLACQRKKVMGNGSL